MARLTPQEALQRLPSGMRKAKAKGKALATEFVRGIWTDSDCFVYLYKRGKGGIIAPAVDNLPPLLGQSETADFTVDLPPSLEAWLQDYAHEVEYQWSGSWLVDENDGGGDNVKRIEIPFMCQAVWGQSAPYNNNLNFGGNKCLAGCWTVMVGIIMQYWGTKGYYRGCLPTSKYSYVGRNYSIPANKSIKRFDYSHLAAKPKTAAEKKAVATLLEYIGKACKVDYATDVTYAYTNISMPFLISHLRLGSKIRQVSASAIGAAKFEQLIYDELQAGRPVGLRGAHGSAGHYFVCDGYREADNTFHMNWGWEEKYNGYYAMSALNPTAANTYNEGKHAIINIQPEYRLGDVNADGDVNVTDVMEITQQIIGHKPMTESADINSDGEVNATDQQTLVKYILGK